jgi:hypothetical protein
LAVLRAAPVKSMNTGGVTFASSEYSPPPYSKVVPLKAQLRHKIPSTANLEPSTFIPSTIVPVNGGTIGTAPAGDIMAGARLVDSCADVEVWFPTSDMESAPNPNESTEHVIFRISPPSNPEICGNWKYHYARP